MGPSGLWLSVGGWRLMAVDGWQLAVGGWGTGVPPLHAIRGPTGSGGSRDPFWVILGPFRAIRALAVAATQREASGLSGRSEGIAFFGFDPGPESLEVPAARNGPKPHHPQRPLRPVNPRQRPPGGPTGNKLFPETVRNPLPDSVGTFFFAISGPLRLWGPERAPRS